MLLKVEGIYVYQANKDGRTPLCPAAFEGHQEIVSMLLKVEGIDVNLAYNGETPLFKAAQKNQQEIVSMLQKSGAI